MLGGVEVEVAVDRLGGEVLVEETELLLLPQDAQHREVDEPLVHLAGPDGRGQRLEVGVAGG